MSNIKGWGRRPSKPKERIEWQEEDLKADPRVGNTVATPNQKLCLIADQILRDDANSVNEETGKKRGLKGQDPILFEEHIYDRRRREILNQNGVPEPGLMQGIYWRTHPEGRKVNSKEAQERGASWFR